MPLIPYPNVPKVPGVPDVLRAAGAVSAVVVVAQQFGLIASSTYWGILNANGNEAIRPDSVVAFDYRGESRIASYPVEDGGFSSYNKVRTPVDIRIVMTCGGNSYMPRQAFLSKLEALKDSLELVSIVTPDRVYQSLNVVSLATQRIARNGVSLLAAEVGFIEVQSSATASYAPTAKPSGAAAVSNGSVNPTAPTTKQATAMGTAVQ